MKKQKLKVEIEVWDIKVEQVNKYDNGWGSGWYEFNYSIKVNGGKKKLGELNGSWSNQPKTAFKRVLNGGYASKLVLESRF